MTEPEKKLTEASDPIDQIRKVVAMLLSEQWLLSMGFDEYESREIMLDVIRGLALSVEQKRELIAEWQDENAMHCPECGLPVPRDE